MRKEPLANSDWTLQEVIKAIPAIIVGLSSACFMLGLLVVNLYLAKYGVYSKEFLRTEYVLAGALLVLFLAMAEVSISYIKDWTKKVRIHWKDKKYIRIILAPWGLFFAVFCIPSLLLFLDGNPVVSLKLLGAAVFGVLVAWVTFYNVLADIKRTFGNTQNAEFARIRPKELHEKLASILLPIVFMLVGLATYANTTYSYISAVYGGGKRATAIIFPTPRGYEVCKALSLPINANLTVGPLEILTESEKELTILIENGLSDQKVAIQLNKELLDAIQTRSNTHYMGLL